MRRVRFLACVLLLACAPAEGPSDAAESVDGGSGDVDASAPVCRGSLESCGEGESCCDGFSCEVGACRGLAGKPCGGHSGCVEALLCIGGACAPCRSLAEPCGGSGDCCGIGFCSGGFCEE